MKSIKKLMVYLILVCSYSCKKVIELNLKNSDIKYVIEGVITNEPGTCRVSVSESKAFYQDNQFPAISGAIVKVKNNDAEFQLMETQPGVYETKLVVGTPGHIYQLAVTINNQIFTATCTMPRQVTIDTLYISPGPFGQFRFATVGYKDPAGYKNNYRFVQYVNTIKDPSIFCNNDEFTDGQPTITQLDTGVDKKDDPRNINSGDIVTIEMFCLDDVIYQYWSGLRSGGGDGSENIASPANPLTNINGGALGYFSAHTVDRKTIIVP